MRTLLRVISRPDKAQGGLDDDYDLFVRIKSTSP